MESVRSQRRVVVHARHLVKRFNGFPAVDGIDFEVYEGECLGFLGPNGAGKTTTVRMIYGMVPLTSGELKVLGMDVRKDFRAIKRRIGVLPQENNLDTELTVLENLQVYGNYFSISGKAVEQKLEELLNFLNLQERTNSAIDQLSGGMKRRLLLARSLLNDPELLILDEPTTGLDPQARHLIWEKLRHLKTENVTQILTTHYMDEAAQICDRVVIMDRGKIKAEGEPHSLVRQFVSREVLELRVNPKRRSEVLSLLGNIAEGFESHNDLLLFYTRDAESLYKTLTAQKLEVDYVLYRQSTLEDVFLKLTGRTLRE